MTDSLTDNTSIDRVEEIDDISDAAMVLSVLSVAVLLDLSEMENSHVDTYFLARIVNVCFHRISRGDGRHIGDIIRRVVDSIRRVGLAFRRFLVTLAPFRQPAKQ